jgi:hypothetical protein
MDTEQQQAPAPGWWLASDGNWYPPQPVASAQPVPGTPGGWDGQPYRAPGRKPNGARVAVIVAVVLGALLLIGGIGAAVGGGDNEDVRAADDDEPRTTTTVERRTTTTARPTTTTTVPPLTKDDFVVTLTTLESQCFNTAGALVTVEPEVANLRPVDSDYRATLVYEIHGGENVETFNLEIAGTNITYRKHVVSTSTCSPQLTVVTTNLIER